MSDYGKSSAGGRAVLAVVLLVFALGTEGNVVQAQLITIGFECVTPGASAENIATGEQQLWLDVYKHGEEEVAYFRFRNVGLMPASIADIYIQDGQLTELLFIIDKDDPVGGPYGDPGVDFDIGATPGNLPDGQYADPPFVATKRFSMDSDPPVSQWGIDPGEQLEAVYSIAPDKTVYDIEQEILAGTLRIGYHVQSFGDGDSASFVNTPEPASLLLLGLGSLIFLKKSRKKH